MPNEMNPNEIAALFAHELVKDLYSSTIKKATKSLNATAPIVTQNLNKYAIENSRSFSEIRTIVCESPSLLSDIYQPAILKCGNSVISEDQFYESFQIRHRAVIRGHAGAGKSLFLKRHFLKRLSRRKAIPIFYELRFLNENFSNLFSHLYDYAKKLFPWLEVELFRTLLRNGRFELYLDALDEVKHTIRSAVNSNISHLCMEFPRCPIIVTTRYGIKYSTPASITEYHVQPFSLEQASALVLALDFHEDSKLRFHKALNEGLYDRSSDLLSNPLLCSIMLLTYRRFATIPDRLHLYYQQAYEVLFSRHDAGKENGFKRDLLSEFDVSEMQSIINYLAAVSYASEQFEFSDSELAEMIKESLQANALIGRSEDVREDLIEAVSMIHPDGLHFKFVHRSFQEFFCAHFISKATNEIGRACIDAVKMRQDTDSVIPMAIALNEDRFQESWLKPNLEEDLSRYNGMILAKKFFDVVKSTYPYIKVDKNRLILKPGSSARSRSFGVYETAMGQEGQGMLIPDSKFKGLRGYDDNLVSYIDDFIRRSGAPKDIKIRFRDGDHIIDLESAAFVGLIDLAIWQYVAPLIVARLRLWNSTLTEESIIKSASPLRAFERAAAIGVRRVEGDLAGGKNARSENTDL